MKKLMKFADAISSNRLVHHLRQPDERTIAQQAFSNGQSVVDLVSNEINYAVEVGTTIDPLEYPHGWCSAHPDSPYAKY